MSNFSLAYIFLEESCPVEALSQLRLGLVDSSNTLRRLSPQEFNHLDRCAQARADQMVLEWLRKNAPVCLKKEQDLPLVPELLRWIAATGKLFFREKRIVCDLFSSSTLIFQVQKSSENQWTVTGKIREQSKEFPLSSCAALKAGQTPYYIHQGQLKQIEQDLPWKQLHQLYSHSPVVIDDSWRKFLETFKDEDCLEMDPPTFFDAQDPLPILCLSDRTGGFATLKMDYGQNRCFPYLRGHPRPSSQSFRNICSEKQWEVDLLETDFILKPSGTTQYYCPLEKVSKSLTFLLELGWTIIDCYNNRIALCTDSHLTVKEAAKHLIFHGTFNYGQHQTNLKDVLGCFNRRERFISLGDGIVGLLPEKIEEADLQGIAQQGEWVADECLIRKDRAGLLASLLDQTKTLDISDSLRHLCSGNNLISLSKEPPSSLFYGSLRHYQQTGLNWLMFLYRNGLHGLLADDMGLGKTVQVIAFLATIQLSEEPILIVMPTTLLFNWKAEIQKFFPSASVYIHHGPHRSNTQWNCNILLTSYTTLRLDQALFQQQAFHCVILDEAHVIKNPSSQTAQAIFALNSTFRLSLTGTPIENSLSELWSQFHFLLPGALGSLTTFQSQVGAAGVDPRFVQRIRRQIKPFILRRCKKEVAADLPEKIEQTIWIEMLPEQRQLYDSFLSKTRKQLLHKVNLEGVAKHRFEILEVLLRLRQICCHPQLIAGHLEEALAISSAKIQQVIDDIKILAQEKVKVLIYSQFTSLLKIVATHLKECNFGYLYLDGQTTDRASLVHQFQNDPQWSFFLISLKAGGVGLNLTAADYVLLLDPWWNEAVEQQAIDRAHRIGRRNSVIAKRYITVDTIEEKIMRLKDRKKSLADDLLEGTDQLSSLTADDLNWLIN